MRSLPGCSNAALRSTGPSPLDVIVQRAAGFRFAPPRSRSPPTIAPELGASAASSMPAGAASSAGRPARKGPRRATPRACRAGKERAGCRPQARVPRHRAARISAARAAFAAVAASCAGEGGNGAATDADGVAGVAGAASRRGRSKGERRDERDSGAGEARFVQSLAGAWKQNARRDANASLRASSSQERGEKRRAPSR